MLKPIAFGTAVAGTLDILFAMILTIAFGSEIGKMLRYVGSGPFPSAVDMGATGSLLGLLTHFALMAIMTIVYVLLARRTPAMIAHPVQWGIIYGLATYVVMNWLVVPLRFDAPLPPKPLSIATQLFAHVILVGIPIALITARSLKPRFA